MIINDWIHLIAGVFILVGMALGAWVHPYWYLLPVLVGANFVQFGLTKFCPLGSILKKLGIPEQRADDKSCCH